VVSRGSASLLVLVPCRGLPRLLALSTGARAAVVANARDGLPADVRDAGARREIEDLSQLGLDAREVDVRDSGAAERLSSFDVVWVRGGNTFVLRSALAETGADQVLVDLIGRDALVYVGYSAGACVLAPDLVGLEQVDQIARPATTGLGVLDRPFVPHVRSPGHPETTACDALAAWHRAAGRAPWALSDGDALVIDGVATEMLRCHSVNP
jgi:dipeptidase E